MKYAGYGLRVVDLEGSVDTCPGDLSVEADWFEATLPQAAPSLRLNELVADNQTGFTDEFGQREDWLEIMNDGPHAISLANMAIANDYFDPNSLWALPPKRSLASGERLVIFCDGQTEQGPLHAPWRLSRAGDSVVLLQIRSDGTKVLLDTLSFGYLPPDTSYGRPHDRGAATQLARPTPGGPNSGAADPKP